MNAIRTQERARLLRTLKSRFEQHRHRHEGVAWEDVPAGLDANPAALG
jgi:hypothetical protein